MKMNKRIITVIIVLAVIVIFAVITVVGSLRNQPAKLGVQVLDVNLAGKIPTIDTIAGRVAKFW
jgi:uncharacterized alpha/beta hydrolase family protein